MCGNGHHQKESGMIAETSTYWNRARDYLLSPIDRAMFDWLIYNQERYGIHEPFRHSIAQTKSETGINRYLQDKALERFKEMGFLQVGTEPFGRMMYRTYKVDFKTLAKPKILGQIVASDSDTYKDYECWINELAKSQAKRPKTGEEKRLTPLDRLMIENEAKRIYDEICKVWNARLKMYNNGDLTDGVAPERARVGGRPAFRKEAKERLKKLLLKYSDFAEAKETITGAFTAYCDSYLKNEVGPSNLLDYFFTETNGEFPVVDEYTERHRAKYSRKNQNLDNEDGE